MFFAGAVLDLYDGRSYSQDVRNCIFELLDEEVAANRATG